MSITVFKSKGLVFCAALLGVLFLVESGLAAPINVENSYHNLSTTAPDILGFIPSGNPYRSTNVTEICIFCHTPHSGNDPTTSGPLWNRMNPTTSFTMYVSSRTGTAAGARTINKESLICLSCHDGSIATNAIINKGPEGVSVPEGGVNVPINIVSDGDGAGNPAILGALIGAGMDDAGLVKTPLPANGGPGYLDDDHPISMNMQTSFTNFTGEYRDPAGAAATDPATLGVRFFGDSGAGVYNVECSSCHNPHVDYLTAGNEAYAPFLVMPNTGSDLCYACHIK